MKKIRVIIVIGIILAGTVSSWAQDIHFSQFYMSPLNLNPAMTGVIKCDQRLVANFRNQWAGVIGANAYNTGSASYDRKMAVGQEDYFGVGGTLWADVAGEANFGTRQLRLSSAFSKKMGGSRKTSHYLSAGVEIGFTQRSVSENDLRWPSQVNAAGIYDPNSGTGETIADASFIYPDLGGGLVWFSTLGERKSVYGGIALAHLNQPRVSFLGEDANLYSRLTIHVGGEYPLNPKMSLKPDFIYLSQGPHKQYNIGSALRFKLGGTSTVRKSSASEIGQFFQVGTWLRLGQAAGQVADDGTIPTSLHTDALILMTRFDFDNYGIGLSYDLNISKLNQGAAGNGSFELSLVYLICGSSSRPVYCPTF